MIRTIRVLRMIRIGRDDKDDTQANKQKFEGEGSAPTWDPGGGERGRGREGRGEGRGGDGSIRARSLDLAHSGEATGGGGRTCRQKKRKNNGFGGEEERGGGRGDWGREGGREERRVLPAIKLVLSILEIVCLCREIRSAENN